MCRGRARSLIKIEAQGKSHTGGRGRVPREIKQRGLGVAFVGVGEQELVELMWPVDHPERKLPAPDEGIPQT